MKVREKDSNRSAKLKTIKWVFMAPIALILVGVLAAEMNKGYWDSRVNGMKRLLTVLLLVACSACGQKQASNQSFQLIDSKAWVDNRRNIYWLDSDSIMFVGVETKVKNLNNPSARDIMIWNTKTNNIYKLPTLDAGVCFRDGNIYYGKSKRKYSRKIEGFYVAPLVRRDERYVVGEERRIHNVMSITYKCSINKVGKKNGSRRSIDLPEYGLQLMGIENEVDEYKNNPRLGLYRDGVLLKVFPIRSYQVMGADYIAHSNSYHIVSQYQPDLKASSSRVPWPKDIPDVSWILDDAYNLKEYAWPKRWRSAGGVWTKYGFVAYGYDFRKDNPGINDTGIFMLKDTGAEEVLGGWAARANVDSSGCKIAFSHAPSFKEDIYFRTSKRTLKLLNLCKDED